MRMGADGSVGIGGNSDLQVPFYKPLSIVHGLKVVFLPYLSILVHNYSQISSNLL